MCMKAVRDFGPGWPSLYCPGKLQSRNGRIRVPEPEGLQSLSGRTGVLEPEGL